MYRKILLLIFVPLALSSQAQVREVLDALKPQKPFQGEPILKKKSQVISMGAGFPNNVGQFLDLGGVGSYFSTDKSGAGPFFIRYEYLLKDNFGIGASVAYARAKETYKNPFGSGTITGEISGFSILFSSYYHFYTTNKFDTYSKGSIGLNIWAGTYKDENDMEAENFTAPTPVAYNAVLGLRYFAMPKLHLLGELGFSNLKFSAGIGIGFKIK